MKITQGDSQHKDSSQTSALTFPGPQPLTFTAFLAQKGVCSTHGRHPEQPDYTDCKREAMLSDKGDRKGKEQSSTLKSGKQTSAPTPLPPSLHFLSEMTLELGLKKTTRVLPLVQFICCLGPYL